MANKSQYTRKQQVLLALLAKPNQWLLTTEIETAAVGGSSGTRRLRELRAEGWPVESRPHPSKDVDQWQYRYAIDLTKESVSQAEARILGIRLPPAPPVRPPPQFAWQAQWACRKCGSMPASEPATLLAGVGRGVCPSCGSGSLFRSM